MKISFALIACALLLAGCSGSGSPDGTVDKGTSCEREANKAKFDSFLSQFAKFDGDMPDESFFTLRKQFPGEKWCPEISRNLFSAYIPHLCGNGEKEFCYRPCYKIEKNNYHLLSIKRERYSYDDNMLATYSRQGAILDTEIVGVNDGGASAYSIEPVSENEITCTQYRFKDIECAYNGDCDISVYKVTIDDNGIIGKSLISEKKNVKVSLLD